MSCDLLNKPLNFERKMEETEDTFQLSKRTSTYQKELGKQFNIKELLKITSEKQVAQTVKRLSTMRETRVRSLGWEDPLEKEMAIHSRTIAWKVPWTEETGRL